MWTDRLRREASRHAWVLAAVPLAGACVSAAAYAACMWAAETVLDLEIFDDVEEASQQ